MRSGFSISLFLGILFVLFSLPSTAQNTGAENPPPPPPSGGDYAVDNPDAIRVPADVILIKGAVPSASDASTPLPESGNIRENVYINRYFGLQYLLGADWFQRYTGPPPSDSGYYVLSQFEPSSAFKGPSPGTILVSAQDLFFGRTPVRTALQSVKKKVSLLNAEYKLERQPTEVKIGDLTFYRMDYMSPVAELHWYTLTTEIRCHSVEFAMTGSDTSLLEGLIRRIEKLHPEAAADSAGSNDSAAAPVCIRDFATGDNVALRVEPVLTDKKFNAIPVRIIIDRNGRVKHIHVISAFPEQAKAITDALLQWEFKPYKVNGQPVEVETGLMFGAAARRRGVTGAGLSD